MDATNSTPSNISSINGVDQPYRFGRRPTTQAPFPFTHREFARLLILRGRVKDALAADDQRAGA
jgi:hypothetical protein